MKIARQVFNAFQELSYIIWDEESRECAIIDPGCYRVSEQQRLVSFIEDRQLIVKYLLITHIHLDHYFGAPFVSRKYEVPVSACKDDEFLLELMPAQANAYGTPLPDAPIAIGQYIQGGDTLYLGQEPIEILHVPGHSPGSVAFYLPQSGCVICGDALFQGSIGRTDLPGGDLNQLIESIQRQLLTLPPETVAYPGHGYETTIGDETIHNPFLRNTQINY